MKSDNVQIGPLDFLLGGGEMGQLIREFDWASTSLGDPAGWPQSLRSAISICLHSSFPTAIYWGEDFCLLYNDAWAPIPADRHPAVLGRPAQEVWSAIWDVVGPQFEAAYKSAEAFSTFDQLLMMERAGKVKESWWNYSLTPIRGENGRIAGILNQGHEVTGRVLAERRRTEELARQRKMFEQAPGFITVLNGPEHRFEFVNQSYTRLFGERNYVGKTIYEAFPELAGQGFYEWLDGVYSTGERLVQQRTPIQLNHPGAPSEVRYLDFIYEPLLDESGQVTGIFCEGYDVTEAHISRVALEASEAALREQTRTLETLNRVSAELALELDLKRLVQTVTDAGREMTGAEIGGYFHSAGRDHFDLFTLSGAESPTLARLPGPRASPVFAPAFLTEGVMRSDDILLDPRYGRISPHFGLPDGHAPVRSYLAMSVVSRSGEVLGGLFYGHSAPAQFTLRHEKLMSALAAQAAIAIDNATLFQQVQSANETLEQRVFARSRELSEAHSALRQAHKMEAVGQLTGGIAHDFNNLLAGIIGSLEMIERRIANGRMEGLDRYLNAAHDSAHRAATLTQRLLAFSRRQTLDPKPTDVNRLVAGMGQLISSTIGPSINIRTIASGDLWLSKIDAPQLESALVNLTLNARDAMPNGGELTVQTRNVSADSAAGVASPLPDGDFVEISVSDTGTGIAPEVLERIFDPFFTTKPIGQGTGLGLSMIHGFVHQSGGTIQARSTHGMGTTISLYLPRYLGDREQVPSRCPSQPGTRGETVLVIDDEPHVRMLMCDALRERGYQVNEAMDGPSGLQMLQSMASIDLLVTDVGLPGGMNGRQVADAARALLPSLDVLFVTGYAQNSAVSGDQLPNGMAVLLKPFGMDSFAQKVGEMLTTLAHRGNTPVTGRVVDGC
ncbi:phospho-acceptor domain-containing protein [Pseudomonas graminis]|uniref:ATP-binding protein n=1 Tax=Pseudomonas graminis TaxID=158627 RepID=UPI0010D69C83|nr:ATP-binding protein [Pseudomonas graminis]TDV58034.1 phospho-acceptor domain-containing protein [Pseudomonas graminis]